MPGRRVHPVRFAPLRRDGRHLHSRPRGRQRVRPDQDRCSRPWRTGRQVQSPRRHRSRGTRASLRPAGPRLAQGYGPARSRSLAPNRGRAASSNQSRLRRNCSGDVSRAMSPSTSVIAQLSTNKRSSSPSTFLRATIRSDSASPRSRARLRASKSRWRQLRRQYLRGRPAPGACSTGLPHQAQDGCFVTVTK